MGVIDLTPGELLAGNFEQLEIFLISRLPRLLAILCTGIGMSVAGLIMQQLCSNKFVSPTTGATISSAQFGILLALLFMPASTLWSRAIFAFATWFIQRIQFKDVVMVPLVGIMFGNVIGGITNYLAYKYEMTQALSSWLVGHFSLVLKGRYEIVWLTVPLVILAFLFANHFNIVGLGKDFSKNLGVPYNLVLFSGLTIAAMITASIGHVQGRQDSGHAGGHRPVRRNLRAGVRHDRPGGDCPLRAAHRTDRGHPGKPHFHRPAVLPAQAWPQGHPSGRRRNKLLLHHAQPEGRCRPVNTVAIRANRRKLLILAFLVLLCAAGPKLIVMLITAFAIGGASIVFQSIINNTIVTPCLLGMNSLYTLIHTAVVFFLGSASVVASNANLSFAVDVVLMGIAATVIYSWIFKKTKHNVLYVLLVGTVLQHPDHADPGHGPQ